ncbi:hypothetical protein, partial [Streptomyces sp. NRRL WC-3774]|uniref:hypothetical protein n=1 Tax=Streptomyces sp. NRRL WC-3774 TaxID=1463937 RepID=UPI001F3900F6
MPAFLNPVFGLLLLRTGAEGADTLPGPEVRSGAQRPTPRPHPRCGPTSRTVRPSCAARRRRAESRWAGRCVPCLLY